jgi:hypothetical protein
MDNEKVQVLLALYTITQENLKDMRSRVLTISSTSITFFTISVGWIVQKQTKPSLQETLLLTCIITVFWIGNLKILLDIRRGFTNAMGIALRIEKSLNLYTPKFFNDDHQPLFPESYSKPNTAKHFKKFEFVLSFSAIAFILILMMRYIFG